MSTGHTAVNYITGHKLAVAFDGSDATHMVRRMTQDADTYAQRDIAGGCIALSRAASFPADGSFTAFTGLPVSYDPAGITGSPDQFTQLEGAFTGIHWDEDSGILTITSDPFGMCPLYWRRSAHGLAVFSETKAVAAEPDLTGWGGFLALGFPVGASTLLAGVERFPAATVMKFDTRTGNIESRRYWELDTTTRPWSIEVFVDALADNVRRYASYAPENTVLLSGGCDSRLILFLLQRLGLPTRALTVAHDDELGDADGRCAKAAASAAGVPWTQHTASADFFDSRKYLEYVRAIDASNPTLGLFISKVFPFVPHGGVWDGLIPGFIFINAQNPGSGFSGFMEHKVAGLHHNVWRSAEQLFGTETATRMRTSFQNEFQKLASQYSDDDRGVAQIVLEQRARRRAAQNPLMASATQALPLLPGLHRNIVESALATPYGEKQHGAFYCRLLRAVHPRALSAPILSGGGPISRNVLDVAALQLRARLHYERAISRHPRLMRVFRGHRTQRKVSIPSIVRSHLATDTDPWINREALANADPATPAGFRLWALYFHWSMWRALHGVNHGSPSTVPVASRAAS